MKKISIAFILLFSTKSFSNPIIGNSQKASEHKILNYIEAKLLEDEKVKESTQVASLLYQLNPKNESYKALLLNSIFSSIDKFNKDSTSLMNAINPRKSSFFKPLDVFIKINKKSKTLLEKYMMKNFKEKKNLSSAKILYYWNPKNKIALNFIRKEMFASYRQFVRHRDGYRTQIHEQKLANIQGKNQKFFKKLSAHYQKARLNLSKAARYAEIIFLGHTPFPEQNEAKAVLFERVSSDFQEKDKLYGASKEFYGDGPEERAWYAQILFHSFQSNQKIKAFLISRMKSIDTSEKIILGLNLLQSLPNFKEIKEAVRKSIIDTQEYDLSIHSLIKYLSIYPNDSKVTKLAFKQIEFSKLECSKKIPSLALFQKAHPLFKAFKNIEEARLNFCIERSADHKQLYSAVFLYKYKINSITAKKYLEKIIKEESSNTSAWKISATALVEFYN